MKTYVFDTFALMAYFRREKAGYEVRSLLKSRFSGDSMSAVSVVNLGELYYMLTRKVSSAYALRVWNRIGLYGLTIYEANDTRTLIAASLKAIIRPAKPRSLMQIALLLD